MEYKAYICARSFKCIAEVAHLVEHNLAKVGVAGSNPVFRSFLCARVAELVDAQDLKSCNP